MKKTFIPREDNTAKDKPKIIMPMLKSINLNNKRIKVDIIKEEIRNTEDCFDLKTPFEIPIKPKIIVNRPIPEIISIMLTDLK